jgi:hypothetical protein
VADKSLSFRICSNCENSYPVINGVGVFYCPIRFLLYTDLSWKWNTKSSFAINNGLKEFEQSDADAGILASGIEMIKEGMAGNISVLEKSCQPIMEQAHYDVGTRQ